MKKLEELGISKFPWELNNRRHSSYRDFGHVIDPDGFLVAEACGEDYETINATARLIAAAPELYDAVRGLLEIVCDDCQSKYPGKDGKCLKCPRVVAAEEALAKAAGEEESK